jgi:hypothetical protein
MEQQTSATRRTEIRKLISRRPNARDSRPGNTAQVGKLPRSRWRMNSAGDAQVRQHTKPPRDLAFAESHPRSVQVSRRRVPIAEHMHQHGNVRTDVRTN